MFILVTIIFCRCIYLVKPTCLGTVGGSVCCAGYTLNISTGKCEKCPLGFYGEKCTQKCPVPSYGEDCQYVCSCDFHLCDFVIGCISITASSISTEISTARVHTYKLITNLTSGKSSASLHTSISQNEKKETFSTTYVLSSPAETILKNLSTNEAKIPILGNGFIVYIIVGLVGLFVLFFGIFAITYFYQKCFRRSSTNLQSHGIINDHVHYKGLHFGIEEQELMIHQDHRRGFHSDPTYLSPVFNGNTQYQEGESQNVQSNRAILENNQVFELVQGNAQINESHNEEIRLEQEKNKSDHVYVDIIDENIDEDCERRVLKERDSHYVNTDK
ncbi:uncharacterized protein LOC134256310 [Saccostrea cucullata]|uniref:uncharacterized protein LOC134256310 n=1 Tax=Saccostrea cuccullata TaxID=36930 RepID=UPI002ED40150